MSSRDFSKYLGNLLDREEFTFKKGKGNTVKIIHSSGVKYSVHPGRKALLPLQSWVNKLNKQN